MKRNFKKNGFSLIEVLVSTTLFVIIITGALSVFKLVIESQRSALATQNVEEGLKYFLEVTSKEIRMAKRNNGKCDLPSTSIYKVDTNISGDILTFRNYRDQCVTYSLEEDIDGVKRFMIERDGVIGYYITPAKINVSELSFFVGAGEQSTVTMKLSAYALGKNINKSTMRIQTTLSPRYYKKD
jgi:prepilin-type N-terminal cleavage/methylation domain-containing protein